MYGAAVIAAMQAASNSFSSDPLGLLNLAYGKTRKGTKPKKSKAVQKRRKANKLASKQRKSSK